MSSQLDIFRSEARAWLEANYPSGMRDIPEGPEGTCWGGRKWKFASDDQRIWLERMAGKGWTVPRWPREYGGGGLSGAEAAILAKEMARIKARSPLDSLGIWMLGPALLKYGTEEQKREHLPKIARGEIRWAQGYSEPGAGSDLASVRTFAEDAGDHFIVNGSKIWTTNGDKCDWIFAIVRTDRSAPKHLGISFLLIDMDQPGVKPRPIKLISGDAHFAETFFDNAIASKANLVGELNRGWDVAKYLLTFERNSIGSSEGRASKESLASAALRILGENGLAKEAALREEIVANELEGWANTIAVERTRDLAAAGMASPISGSMLKILVTEHGKRRTELMMAMCGAEALRVGSQDSYEWLQAPSITIGGGTTEIQLNIIAKRGLGLPEA